MATEVVLPKLGLTQDEGTIVRWVKAEGSRVNKGEPLFEVLTDKATIEVEAPASGVLLRILVPEGATAPVATPIAVIGEPGEHVTSAAPHPVAAPASRSQHPPSAGAPAGGAIRTGAAGSIAIGDGRVRVSPRARTLAAAHGIDLGALRGSGPDGRIVERDVQRAVEAGGTGRAAAARHATVPGAVGAPAAPAAAPGGPARPVISARLRAIIARRMTESLQGTAQLTLTTEADMAEAAKLRDQVGAELERRGGDRPTYTDLVVRAAALALRDHPRLNARWADDGVRLLPDIHVGVAVALDEGLVVPVIRHADRATLAQISAALRDLSERARTLRLKPDEMDGGTFTVTNLGMYDVDAFTPILNPPEAAILGVGRVHRRPVAAGEASGGEDRVEVRPVMALSLTFDHRVVDGAPAAQFLQRIKHVLEHPYLLLLP
ncbi:MAG TPA: dihydrolipoamide acetyltransferase family protein [bacterium]|nr:dihydrolipoamide acetyltransferase family protein [bacterium]